MVGRFRFCKRCAILIKCGGMSRRSFRTLEPRTSTVSCSCRFKCTAVPVKVKRIVSFRRRGVDAACRSFQSDVAVVCRLIAAQVYVVVQLDIVFRLAVRYGLFQLQVTACVRAFILAGGSVRSAVDGHGRMLASFCRHRLQLRFCCRPSRCCRSAVPCRVLQARYIAVCTVNRYRMRSFTRAYCYSIVQLNVVVRNVCLLIRCRCYREVTVCTDCCAFSIDRINSLAISTFSRTYRRNISPGFHFRLSCLDGYICRQTGYRRCLVLDNVAIAVRIRHCYRSVGCRLKFRRRNMLFDTFSDSLNNCFSRISDIA